ncbi:MAG: TlpA family protein disulfide reductase [Bacteroidales bacterium]|nr:TlpA family protein disulfide reductase [Bacteroidales bacterium]
MKKINILLLILVLPFFVKGNELEELLQRCNEVYNSVQSAYYESHISQKQGNQRTEFIQKVYIKKNDSRTGLPMFNLIQSRNDKEEFQQFFNNKQFTIIDFDKGIAYQYEREDRTKYLQMINQMVLHPYVFCKALFKTPRGKHNLELMKDTIIGSVSYKRISRTWKDDDKDIQDVFFINSQTYIVERQQSVAIGQNIDSGLSILSFDIEYKDFKSDVAYFDDRFVYKSNQMPYTLQYMSYSSLKKEWNEQEKNQSSLAYGSVAEDFVITDCYGEKIDSKEHRDKVLVVAFYYNICSPCMLMLQDLERLYQKYENKKLKIIAINPIDNKQDDYALRMFAKDRKLDYHLCSVKRKTMEDGYLVYSYPTVFVIDRKGRIQFSHQGYNALFFQKIDKSIGKLL